MRGRLGATPADANTSGPWYTWLTSSHYGVVYHHFLHHLGTALRHWLHLSIWLLSSFQFSAMYALPLYRVWLTLPVGMDVDTCAIFITYPLLAYYCVATACVFYLHCIGKVPWTPLLGHVGRKTHSECPLRLRSSGPQSSGMCVYED